MAWDREKGEEGEVERGRGVCMGERGRERKRHLWRMSERKRNVSERVLRSTRQPRALPQHLQQGASRTRTSATPTTPSTMQHSGRENQSVLSIPDRSFAHSASHQIPSTTSPPLVSRKVAEPPFTSGATLDIVIYCSNQSLSPLPLPLLLPPLLPLLLPPLLPPLLLPPLLPLLLPLPLLPLLLQFVPWCPWPPQHNVTRSLAPSVSQCH